MVLTVIFFVSETTIEEVKALDKAGKIHRKLRDTIRKDDITIPDGGYTIIRFTADNPGIYFFIIFLYKNCYF